MNSKASKRGFNMEIIMFIVVSLPVIGIHCCIWFEQISQL